MFLMEKLRALKMSGSVRAYSDEFLSMAAKLELDTRSDTAIYLYKVGLQPWILTQVAAAESNQILADELSGTNS